MSGQAIDTLLDEERRFPPDPAFAAQANAQPAIYDADPDGFWETEARARVTWLEDILLVTDDGSETLSSFPYDLDPAVAASALAR